jgi:hypothetical protein
VRPQTEEGLPGNFIIAIGRDLSQAPAVIGSGKASNGHGEAVHFSRWASSTRCGPSTYWRSSSTPMAIRYFFINVEADEAFGLGVFPGHGFTPLQA